MKRILFILIILAISLSLFADNENYEDNPTYQERICSPTECYTVIKKLGEGAFGNVYHVENSSGLPFAIKSYKSSYQGAYLSNSLKEFTRGQILNHPNIIKSHDLFMTGSNPEDFANIVLDLVKGKTVAETQVNELSKINALKAASQLIDSLRYALSVDLMHMDMHTGNVMLDTDLNLMVVDLASFFTFEEFYDFVNGRDPNPISEETEGYFAVTGASASVRMNEAVMNTETNVAGIGSGKNEKMRKILKENPVLLDRLIQIGKKAKAVTQPKKRRIMNSVSNNSATEQSMEEEVVLSTSSKADPSSVHSLYFGRLAYVSIEIISLSDLNDDVKIFLNGEINKMASNFEEDVLQGKTVAIEDYLDQLMQILKSI